MYSLPRSSGKKQSRIVFATFHPRSSGCASGDCHNARVENPIARCLDMFEQRRRDDAMGFVPVAKMDRLGIVDADLLGRVSGAMYDARSAMSSVSSSGGYVIDPPPVPTARRRDRWRNCGHGTLCSVSVTKVSVCVGHTDAERRLSVLLRIYTIGVYSMPTITIRVDENLKERMDHHPEINWSEVTRQAITEKITRLEQLERLERLASGSQATKDDVDEIATLVNETVAQQYDEDESSSE